jgi:hypothetical protein
MSTYIVGAPTFPSLHPTKGKPRTGLKAGHYKSLSDAD